MCEAPHPMLARSARRTAPISPSPSARPLTIASRVLEVATGTVVLIILAVNDASRLLILFIGLAWAWCILQLVRATADSGGSLWDAGGDAATATGLDSDGGAGCGGDGGGE